MRPKVRNIADKSRYSCPPALTKLTYSEKKHIFGRMAPAIIYEYHFASFYPYITFLPDATFYLPAVGITIRYSVRDFGPDFSFIILCIPLSQSRRATKSDECISGKSNR